MKRGDGICRVCTGRLWDVFYVLLNENEDTVKFGITSGDPRPRLQWHARRDFTKVVRLVEGLPVGTAMAMELATKAALRLAGEKPASGFEYFPVRALALVLHVVDHYPIPDEGGSPEPGRPSTVA
ncbi:hypothetical protein ABZV67_42595 [Streptomyces sp. NPDC005065]|uniref:hypothetical protein n=1 Tax=Streptomyces sp. NPDC005065 TaxID=3154461 RepID=UPI0033A6C6F5